MIVSEPVIRMENIIKRYYIGKPNELQILNGISLSVDQGEFVSIVGESGSGKSTLMNYNKWNYVVGEIACAFDVDPKKCGTQFGVEVYPMSELENKIPEGCRIAILTISHDVQETVDKLVQCGISGIVDFTHQHFLVPKGVVIKSIDVVSSIQELVFITNSLETKAQK